MTLRRCITSQLDTSPAASVTVSVQPMFTLSLTTTLAISVIASLDEDQTRVSLEISPVVRVADVRFTCAED